MRAPFHWSSLALTVSSVLFFFSYPTVDNDLWGHLLFGRETLANGWPLLENRFSYTAPTHEWINHEWLAEVVFYGIYRVLGSPGLILLKLAIAGAIVWLLDRKIRERVDSRLVRTFALIWTMTILWPGFNVRPQLFTYLLYAVLLSLLYRYGDKSRLVLYWVAPLVLLWINLHGGVAAGIGAFGLFVISKAVEEGRRHVPFGSLSVRLAGPALLSLLCLFVTPYGAELLRFLWDDLQLVRPIVEWQPIPIFGLAFFELKLALVAILFYGFKTRSWRRWDFLLTVVVAVLAFRHMRHTPLVGITAAPLLADAVQRLVTSVEEDSTPARWPTVLRASVATGLLAVALLQLVWVGRIHAEHRFHLVVDPREYPSRAADFLVRNGVGGNVAAPFDWGEYLIWKLHPRGRVSIDGRYTTAYPMEVIDDSLEWMLGREGWQRLLERHPTDVAVTNSSHPVTALLDRDEEWVNVYSDPTATVFARETAETEDLLSRFRDGLLEPPGPPALRFPG